MKNISDKIGSSRLFMVFFLAFWILGVTACGEGEKTKTPMVTETKEQKAIPPAPVPEKSVATGDKAVPPPAETLPEMEKPVLPKDISWLTNDTDPVYASPEAVKGGTFRAAIQSFPLTFRTVGPDSNSSFRAAILGNQLSLIGIHPNTENIVPELATHWAFGPDKKTMYFKLNKTARWSDGTPVTAHDFAYTLTFMRSKHIIAPWYNDYYTRELNKVIVYDDHTLAVVATLAKPDLHMRAGISPTPRHFYGELDKEFVKKFNWKIVPNTGPYQVSDFKKGRHVTFKRKKGWWAENLRYFRHRFNVDRVKYKVVRDYNLEWEHFKKGEIDAFSMTLPQFWHVKSKTANIENGYIHRIWFYNDSPRSPMGLWLNMDNALFKDRDVRYAFAHAINVEKVIEKVLWNDFERLDHAFVGYGPYSDTTINARKYDLTMVKQYMEKSGWERGADGIWTRNGKRFSTGVTYGSDTHTRKLIVLKEEAKRAGVELKLQLMDPSTWFKKIAENKHEVVWLRFGGGLRPSFWQFYHSVNAHKPNTNNITNTDDPEMDKMIDAYRIELAVEERIRLSKEIQRKAHEIGAFVPTTTIPYVRSAYWRWWRLPEVPGTKLSGGLFAPFDSMTGGLFWYDAVLHRETEGARKKRVKLAPVTLLDETYRRVSEP